MFRVEAFRENIRAAAISAAEILNDGVHVMRMEVRRPAVYTPAAAVGEYRGLPADDSLSTPDYRTHAERSRVETLPL